MNEPIRRAVQSVCAHPPFARFVCWRGARRGNRVALTFDDGPRPEFTLAVLDTLDRAGAVATFFVEGHRVEKHPEIVRRILAQGHEIGNHGYEHDGEPLGRQAARCRQALSDCGVATRLFRPPLGRLTAVGMLRLALAGYRTVLWTVDARDSMRHEGKWGGCAPDYGALRAGDVVLMHDDNPLCLAELPVLLAHLRKVALLPVTVSELFGSDRDLAPDTRHLP